MIESDGGYNKFGGFRSINLLKAVYLIDPFLKISGANSRPHSVHLPPFCRGGGVESPTKFSKRWGLAGPQFLEGGDFFQGGLQFLHKK